MLCSLHNSLVVGKAVEPDDHSAGHYLICFGLDVQDPGDTLLHKLHRVVALCFLT